MDGVRDKDKDIPSVIPLLSLKAFMAATTPRGTTVVSVRSSTMKLNCK